MSKTTEFNRERFNQFISLVRQEILNMQAGEGKFRPGALHFEKGKANPAVATLDRLVEFPTKENLEKFLEIAKQDFGATTAQAFRDWSHSIFPSGAGVREPAAVKTFEDGVKDGFYDMFKGARIPLEPKQIKLLEAASYRLAQTFRLEISRTVGEQLGVLVKNLKEQDKQAETKTNKE